MWLLLFSFALHNESKVYVKFTWPGHKFCSQCCLPYGWKLYGNLQRKGSGITLMGVNDRICILVFTVFVQLQTIQRTSLSTKSYQLLVLQMSFGVHLVHVRPSDVAEPLK